MEINNLKNNISFTKSLDIQQDKLKVPVRCDENPTNLNLMPGNYPPINFGKVFSKKHIESNSGCKSPVDLAWKTYNDMFSYYITSSIMPIETQKEKVENLVGVLSKNNQLGNVNTLMKIARYVYLAKPWEYLDGVCGEPKDVINNVSTYEFLQDKEIQDESIKRTLVSEFIRAKVSKDQAKVFLDTLGSNIELVSQDEIKEFTQSPTKNVADEISNKINSYAKELGKLKIQVTPYIVDLCRKLKTNKYPVTRENLLKAHNIVNMRTEKRKDFKSQMEFLSNPIDFEEFKKLEKVQNAGGLQEIFYDYQSEIQIPDDKELKNLPTILKKFASEGYDKLSKDDKQYLGKLLRYPLKSGTTSDFKLINPIKITIEVFNNAKKNLDTMYGGKEKKCKDKIAVVLIGRSLASFETMFKLSGIQAKAVPFSGSNTPIDVEKYMEQSGLNEFIADAKKKGKKIIFTDYTDTGSGLGAFENTLLLGGVNTDNIEFKSFNNELLDQKLGFICSCSMGLLHNSRLKPFCPVMKTKELDGYSDKYFDVNSHIRDIESELDVPVVPRLFQFLLTDNYKTAGKGTRFVPIEK